MPKPKAATFDDLRDYARAFSGWFSDFDRELLRTPLSARRRNEIDKMFDTIADLTEQITSVLKLAQTWEVED